MQRVGMSLVTLSVSLLAGSLLPETGDLGLGDMSGSLLQKKQSIHI